MRKHLALVICTGLIYANASLASNINYSYFELGYVEADWDYPDIDDDGDGYELNASLAVGETLALIGAYQDLEFDDGADGNQTRLGFLYHKPYSTTGDIVMGLAYLETEVDPDVGKSEDDTGNWFSLEIRNMTSPQTEISLGLNRVDIFGDDETGYNFGVVSGSPQGFQFVLRYIDRDDISSILLGLRSSF